MLFWAHIGPAGSFGALLINWLWRAGCSLDRASPSFISTIHYSKDSAKGTIGQYVRICTRKAAEHNKHHNTIEVCTAG